MLGFRRWGRQQPQTPADCVALKPWGRQQPQTPDETGATSTSPAADASWGERELAALVASVEQEPARRHDLVAALREDSPFYAQRGRVVTARMRGWLLASFERVGLPDAAIPFVIEELESGIEPYLVAAAARAVRGRAPPEPMFARYLAGAIDNIRGRDELVTFSAYGVYAKPGQGVTAVREILITLRSMGSAARGARQELVALERSARFSRDDRDELRRCIDALAREAEGASNDCCSLPLHPMETAPGEPASAIVRAVELEDHRGAKARFDDVFFGQPSIVVFFYTRCDNPRKCSLTISRLAGVQRILASEGLLDRIATAALTYDPGFDLADRIAEYGRARSWIDHPRHRLLRAPVNNAVLVRYFELGVGFIASLVNRHRIECFVLDGKGRVHRSFARTRWEEREVIAAAKELCAPKAAGAPPESDRRARRAAISIALSVLAAFFPKCAVCWAAYMSMLGVAGLGRIPYSPWLFGVFALAMIANLASLWIRARRSGSFLGLALSAAGAAVLLIGGLGVDPLRAPWVGIALVAAGSLLGARGPRSGSVRGLWATLRRA